MDLAGALTFHANILFVCEWVPGDALKYHVISDISSQSAPCYPDCCWVPKCAHKGPIMYLSVLLLSGAVAWVKNIRLWTRDVCCFDIPPLSGDQWPHFLRPLFSLTRRLSQDSRASLAKNALQHATPRLSTSTSLSLSLSAALTFLNALCFWITPYMQEINVMIDSYLAHGFEPPSFPFNCYRRDLNDPQFPIHLSGSQQRLKNIFNHTYAGNARLWKTFPKLLKVFSSEYE